LAFSRGGWYPDDKWTGTVTTAPDDTIDGVLLDVYRFSRSSSLGLVSQGSTTVWIGKTDHYVHRYEVEDRGTSLGSAYVHHQRADFSAFDQPLAVELPQTFIDAGACKDAVTQPEAHDVKVTYPTDGPPRAAGRSTDVGAAVSIDGRVTDTWIIRSSGFAALDREAQRAIHSAAFTPGKVFCKTAAAEGGYGIAF